MSLRSQISALLAAALFATACGGGALGPQPLEVREALTRPAVLLAFEDEELRRALYEAIVHTARAEADAGPGSLVLFPVSADGQVLAAPAVEGAWALWEEPLQAAEDSGEGHLPMNALEAGWPDEPIPALGELSERAAAVRVGVNLLALWGLESPRDGVMIERVEGAPYAAAWADGVLRLNPAFLYLAAAAR